MFALIVLIGCFALYKMGVPAIVAAIIATVALLLIGAAAVFAEILEWRERSEWNRRNFLEQYAAAIHLRDAKRNGMSLSDEYAVSQSYDERSERA